MKKLLVILLVMPLFAIYSMMVFGASPVTSVYIHYYRFAEDYTDWNVWVWQSEPVSLDGASYVMTEDDTATTFNYGGVLAKVNLTGDMANATQLGIIIRKGNWVQKDIDIDRFIDIPSETTDGIYHVYFVEGDMSIGESIDDIDGPSRNPKFKSAYFRDMDTFIFTATETLDDSDIRVYANDVLIGVDTIVISGANGTVILDDSVDFTKKYVIEADFSNQTTSSYIITFDGIYDSDEFNNAFGYEGDDLGAHVNGNRTTFRLWAPISESVTLNLYSTGTSLANGGSDTPISTHMLTASEKGTFYIEMPTNLHGTYYTYTVKNGANSYEVIDPYAKSSGVNGKRGLIVDFNAVNPEGFEYDTRADNMVHATDAIIYELHVRDLTSHSSWNGTETNRARYLGLVEEGTSYQGVTTGFDHIVELGITHVQLLPFFDYGVVDETKLDDADYNAFNWGYMPLNFNVLEGSFSSNPYDGLVRIAEMKEVVSKFTEANIRVNMDVVYNHTGLTADSNFNLIVPGYYHRKNENGTFSNGSGTGNETASERYMMRKFMVESLVFWATEYNISGFRFDLMALHDLETMNEIMTALQEVDETIMVYGEPWMGGTSPLPLDDQAGKNNLYLLDGIAAFNDDLRDGVKGSVFAKTEGGFIQGTFSDKLIARTKYGIVGGIEYEGINPALLSALKVWHTSPLKTLNYVTAHDNNTLHDKLYQTLEETDRLDIIPQLMKQANAIVLTSQGISFLHAGDEFMRSKPLDSGVGFDHNSYQSPDSVNQLRWDLKAGEVEMNVFEYYKGLIAFRKDHPSLRMTEATDIIANLDFLYESTTGVISYMIKNGASNDAYEEMLIIHNANSKSTKIKLPTEGGWRLVINGDVAGTESIDTYKGGETLQVAAHSSYVLYRDLTIGDVNYLPVILISSIGGTALIAGGVFIFLRMKKSKIGAVNAS